MLDTVLMASIFSKVGSTMIHQIPSHLLPIYELIQKKKFDTYSTITHRWIEILLN